MDRRVWLGVVSVLAVALTRAGATVPTSARDALEALAQVIDRTFPDISHLSPEMAARRLEADPGNLIFLDLRTAKEFDVSHISGAIRADPGAPNTAAIETASGSLAGKTVIAYCSVGLRSSQWLVRIGHALKERGATDCYNLRGGLFQWRNEERPLTAATGPTVHIHPYSAVWRRYLVREP